jgi:hypothetical protein
MATYKNISEPETSGTDKPTHLIIPGKKSSTGSITSPSLPTALDMVSVASVWAHVMNTAASPRSLPAAYYAPTAIE